MISKLFLILTIIVSVNWSPETATAKESADKKGHLRIRFDAWPKGLNYYTASDVYVSLLWTLTGTSLITADSETYEEKPNVATEWKVGDDRRTYTYTLRKDATFEDGKPITAEDVKFTFDTIYDPKKCILCTPSRNFLGPMEHVKALDKWTVEIKMKQIHFNNLARLGSYPILAKHIYGKGDFNKDFSKIIFGGGAYRYDKKASKFRKTIVLNRIKNHWTQKVEGLKEDANFDTITLKYIKDATVAHEAFKRREIDVFYYDLETIEFWDNQKVAPFTDKRLKTVTAELFNPSSWGGVALNMRSGPLADKNFRKSLQFLFNRDLILEKILKGHFRPSTGPFMRGSKYSYPAKATPFDPKQASKLLSEAGFKKTGPDGILYREIKKNGKSEKERASLTVIYATDKHAPWLTIFKEDAKKAGVELTPRLMEWSAATKLLDEFKFEGFVIGWAGSPVPGPGQLFHGRSASEKGSSNIPGLDHKKLNKLIDEGPAMFDEKKRIQAYHEMEKIIIDEQPYLFRWTKAYHNVAYWSDKIDPTKKPYRKFDGTMERDPFWVHWKAK